MATLAAHERRILTTHVGSLPRRASLSALLFARMSREAFDAEALAQRGMFAPLPALPDAEVVALRAARG